MPEMSDHPIEVEVELEQASADAPVATVRVSGELDIYTAQRLHDALSALDADAVDRVELVATGVTFVDSAGVRSLVVMSDRIARKGKTFAVVEASNELERVLRMTGLADSLIVR